MKIKQYKNKYRQEICSNLGKIKTESELKTVLKIVHIYSDWNGKNFTVDDVEKSFIIFDLFYYDNLTTKDLTAIRHLIEEFHNCNMERKEGVTA